MATIKCFEEIKAWQKARALNEKVGSYIDNGRFKRNFRLIDQIEGSAGSIMDNIAEGFERSGNREFLQFLYFSKGSCGEFRSQLYRALDRKYIQQNEFDELFELSKEVIVMLQKLIEYLEQSELKGTKYKSRNSLTRELVNS
jgi:four helix bundle protein